MYNGFQIFLGPVVFFIGISSDCGDHGIGYIALYVQRWYDFCVGAHSSAEERYVDIVEVIGSIPIAPTKIPTP